MNEQAKEDTRVDLQLKAMEMHTLIETGRGFDVFRVYNGWLYIHRSTLNQTFVPEFYNVNADCRNRN